MKRMPGLFQYRKILKPDVAPPTLAVIRKDLMLFGFGLVCALAFIILVLVVIAFGA